MSDKNSRNIYKRLFLAFVVIHLTINIFKLIESSVEGGEQTSLLNNIDLLFFVLVAIYVAWNSKCKLEINSPIISYLASIAGLLVGVILWAGFYSWFVEGGGLTEFQLGLGWELSVTFYLILLSSSILYAGSYLISIIVYKLFKKIIRNHVSA